MNIKSFIYKLLRISNDINAIKRGKIGKRIGKRITRRITAKARQRLFKLN